MRSTYEARVSEAREIEGRGLQGRDIFVRQPILSDLIKLLWPGEKPAPFLASLSKRDERTAKRWLAGEFDPPLCVMHAIHDEIYKQIRRD